MTEYEVRDSDRVIMRRMNKAMQKSYLKALTEPITNSDDSYRKLEKTAINTLDSGYVEKSKEIIIYVCRKEKEFQVVDNAEGFSKKDVEEKLTEYGEEKSTHIAEGRGLFGQGLLDVLFSRRYGGHIHSIKDNKYIHIQFKWKKKKERGKLRNRRIIKIVREDKASREIRKSYHIPKGNGTNVCFRFKEAGFPQEEKLIEKLSNFYLIRLLNSDPKRIIKVVFLDSEGKIISTHRLNYSFPKGEEISEINSEIQFEKFKPIKISGVLKRYGEPLTQKEAGEDREGGLLVHDEYNHVLDLTLFGYDDSPFAKHFFGSLELTGAYGVVRQKLREHEEILTETRDGFVKTHPFYLQLKEIVDEWLKPEIEKERRKGERAPTNLSKETQKRHKEALNKLNKIFKEINKEGVGPGPETGDDQEKPENDIAFDRKKANIIIDEETVVFLKIDTDIISPGNKVSLESTNKKISVNPEVLTVKEAKSKNNVYSKSILLQSSYLYESGKVIAKVGTKEANIETEVIEKEWFLPTDGIEFNPINYSSAPGSKNVLHLYVDITKIPIGELIILESTNEKIILEDDIIEVKRRKYQPNDVVQLDINYRGTGIGEKGKVIAKYGDCSCEAFISIRSKQAKKGESIFRDIKYDHINWAGQTYFDPDTGVITVNLNHPVNKKYFGNDKTQAERSVELLPHSQMLLADIILDECISYTMIKAYDENKIDIFNPDNPVSEIRYKMLEKKNEIGNEIFDLFIIPKNVKKAIRVFEMES